MSNTSSSIEVSSNTDRGYTSLTCDLFGEEGLEKLLWKTFLTNQITGVEGSGFRLTSYNAKLLTQTT